MTQHILPGARGALGLRDILAACRSTLSDMAYDTGAGIRQDYLLRAADAFGTTNNMMSDFFGGSSNSTSAQRARIEERKELWLTAIGVALSVRRDLSYARFWINVMSPSALSTSEIAPIRTARFAPNSTRVVAFFDREVPGAWPCEPQVGGVAMAEGPLARPEDIAADLVITPLTGWGEGYADVRPSDALLGSLPQTVRNLSYRTIPLPRAGAGNLVGFELEDGTMTRVTSTVTSIPEGAPTAASLISDARIAWREAVRTRLGLARAQSDAAEEEQRQAHRALTATNYQNFSARAEATEEHVSTLPFVPHGLASSRRWGIEVETGAARGIQAPANWNRTGDGSLRSAYEGWTEVQDFEPFDEEVQEQIHWSSCENAAYHDPRVEVFDAERDEYILIPREGYINARDCTSCGQVTRTVRREPQTIRHHAQSDDCAEFVSPILTSMHSKGLEELTTALTGRPITNSAGVHVHVEASDLTPKQLATIVFGYDVLEPLLNASYKRTRRDFCERRSTEEVLQAARLAKAGSAGYEASSGGRYRTLNTHSLSRHGTLEFRAMGPVYEYDYLVRWAMLCRELVNSVANGAKVKDFAKIRSWSDLLTFLARFGREYVRASVFELTGETGSVAALDKAGSIVTDEALAADFEAALQEIVASTRIAADDLRNLASNLVGASSTHEV